MNTVIGLTFLFASLLPVSPGRALEGIPCEGLVESQYLLAAVDTGQTVMFLGAVAEKRTAYFFHMTDSDLPFFVRAPYDASCMLLPEGFRVIQNIEELERADIPPETWREVMRRLHRRGR